MAHVSKEHLEEIKQAAIPLHEAIYDLDAMWKVIRRRVPTCYRRAMDEAVKNNHSAAGDLRACMLDCLPIEPLTDEEIVALGFPGTKD